MKIAILIIAVVSVTNIYSQIDSVFIEKISTKKDTNRFFTVCYAKSSNWATPLLVINGIPIETPTEKEFKSAVIRIDVNNVEKIEILKDSKATALYGTRGINGVILINTKKHQSKSWRDYFKHGK